MRAVRSKEPSDAALVIIPKAGAAAMAFCSLPALAESTHVLTRCGDEGFLAFARRILRRARRVQREGLRISTLSCVVSGDPANANSRPLRRVLAALIRLLEPGAKMMLIASSISMVDALGWTDSLMNLARSGVSLELVF